MPFSIESWMADYCQAVNKTFGARVRFIGLQGSFARGEATARSDIDAVLILDRADAADLTAYSALLDRLPERERSCGFISGWEELTHWEPSELLQFYYDTIPYEGSLDPLLRQITRNPPGRRSTRGPAASTTAAPTTSSTTTARISSGGSSNPPSLSSRRRGTG